MSHYAALPRAVALALPITLGAWTVQAADIIQSAEQVGRFNSFLGMLEATGMADMLKREGPLTVFAPTDEAFAQLPPGTLDRLLADHELLQKAVQSHIVTDAAIPAGDLLGQAVEVATLGGGTLAIDGTDGVIFLGSDRSFCHGSRGANGRAPEERSDANFCDRGRVAAEFRRKHRSYRDPRRARADRCGDGGRA